MNKKHYVTDYEAFPADAYSVRQFPGVAFYVLGWETEPDEDTEWSGYESRTGRVLTVMVGDDYRHSVEQDDLEPLTLEDYCGGCGQIDCAGFVIQPNTDKEVEYEDDPNEIAPCLACGEPKPNSQSCDCTDMWRGETEGGEDG